MLINFIDEVNPVQALFENISKREEKPFTLVELEGESNERYCYRLCFK